MRKILTASLVVLFATSTAFAQCRSGQCNTLPSARVVRTTPVVFQQPANNVSALVAAVKQELTGSQVNVTDEVIERVVRKILTTDARFCSTGNCANGQCQVSLAGAVGLDTGTLPIRNNIAASSGCGNNGCGSNGCSGGRRRLLFRR